MAATSAVPVFDVMSYSAKGDGVTDDTAAITSAHAALIAAGGGILYFPLGVYLVSSPIVIGNATLSTRSVSVQVLGAGGMVEFGQSTSAAEMNAVRAPATILASQNFSGSELVTINGPGEFVFGEIMLQCSSVAPSGLVANSANKSKFERILVLQQNGGSGFTFQTNDAWTGTWGDETHSSEGNQLVTCSTVAGSAGMTIGSSTAVQKINISYWTFRTINILMDFMAPRNSTDGLRLQFCDNIAFYQCAIQATRNSINVLTPAPSTLFPFPSNIQFPSGINFFMTSVQGPMSYPPDGGGNPSWTPVNGALGFYPWMQDNAEMAPPWDRRFAMILESGQMYGSLRTNDPHITSLDGTRSVTNTTTETAFTPNVPFGVDAGTLDTRGHVVRLRAGGRYSCTDTAGLSLQIRVYIDSIAPGNLLLDSGATVIGGAKTYQPWMLEAELPVMSTGPTGCVNAAFAWVNITGTPQTFLAGAQPARPSSGFDTAQAHTFVITAQWSAAEAGDTITLDGGGTVGNAMPGVQPSG